MTEEDQLGRDVARALGARRPMPSRELDARLHAAALQPARATWIVPAALAAAVAVVAGFVIAMHHDGTTIDVTAPTVTRAPVGDPLATATTPAPDTVDLLVAYQSLLDLGDTQGLGLDAKQLARVRDFADELAKQRAAQTAQKEIAMIELRRELDRADIDPARATTVLDRVAAADTAIRKAELVARIATRSVLTVKQRAMIGRGPTTVAGRATIEITSSPPGASAIVDGITVGMTPIRITVSEGAHTVKLDRPGYQTLTLQAAVRDGETRQLATTLERKAKPATPAGSGALMISATPWARVTIDGRDVGTTPIETKLTAGKHKIVLVHDGNKRVMTVDIKDGGSSKLAVDLTDNGPVNPFDSRQ